MAMALAQEQERPLDALAYLECLLALAGFAVLSFVDPPYGRHSSPSSGPRVPARTAWAVQELPSLAVPLYECARASPERLRSAPNRVLLAMFLAHYTQRSLIFPFLIRGGKPTPLYSCVIAFFFCAYNGYLQSRYLSQYAVYADDWVTDPRFLIGECPQLQTPPHSNHRGLFEYVTAANYFGEIVEWGGYALASWSLQGGAFALFTFCVLLPIAKKHHQWYLEKFEDYPKFRKILIPFLF
uniref:Steroid 5 alpha-reductase 1 n=1 Tax=Propithecus coquereli TaxID=379532 RepID=A0A2K6EFH1_PROCO